MATAERRKELRDYFGYIFGFSGAGALLMFTTVAPHSAWEMAVSAILTLLAAVSFYLLSATTIPLPPFREEGERKRKKTNKGREAAPVSAPPPAAPALSPEGARRPGVQGAPAPTTPSGASPFPPSMEEPAAGWGPGLLGGEPAPAFFAGEQWLNLRRRERGGFFGRCSATLPSASVLHSLLAESRSF